MVLYRVFGMFGTMFVACFVASIGRIMWPSDKGGFGMVLGQKLACTGAAKELSGMSGRGSHAIVWLGASSGTLWRRIPRYSVAPAQCQSSNFGRP